MNAKTLWLLGGLLSFAAILLLPETLIPAQAARVAATAALMAALWIGEAIPIPATALLPVVLFPLLGVLPIEAVTPHYANHLVFLFLGGFWIAAAVERSQLHRRIALHVLQWVGTAQDRIVLGFMLATASLSMWLSNTATTMMMLPIAGAVAGRVGGGGPAPFGRALMLGIAYSASIGGVATLIGTPPNAVLAGVVERTLGVKIGFWQWMQFGLPLAALMLGLCWVYLTRVDARLATVRTDAGAAVVATELGTLGPMRAAERRVLWVFGAVATLWVLRGVLPIAALADLGDSAIAMAGAVLLFVLPDGEGRGGRLLDWASAVRIPWDVLILFGGGFALAQGFQSSGLTEWIGQRLAVLHDVPWYLLVAAVALLTIMLTEVTSNTATASMLLPIVAAVAVAAGHAALPAMTATALAASFAFMLPVATPPNAIVFASRQVTMKEMVRAGVWLNLLGWLVITLFVTLLLPRLWGIPA